MTYDYKSIPTGRKYDENVLFGQIRRLNDVSIPRYTGIAVFAFTVYFSVVGLFLISRTTTTPSSFSANDLNQSMRNNKLFNQTAEL